MLDTIERKINQLLRKYHTANPFSLCDYLGIKVFKCNIPGRGIYHTHKRIPMLYINETLSEHEQLLVCAHELAHHLLHRRYNRVFFDNNTHLKTDRYESEADEFAERLMEIYCNDFFGEVN